MSKKMYASADEYERKLRRVMDRLGVTDYQFNWSRSDAWVQFRYKGNLYKFEHNVGKARDSGQKLHYGSDCFAQLVLSLEDLARMVERGIYDLQVWVSGMKMLPEAVQIPGCFIRLNFTEMPAGIDEVKKRYRKQVKLVHPDVGGTEKEMIALQRAYQQALDYFKEE